MEKKLISVTADDVVALLNEAFSLDPAAVQALVDHRVPCNKALGDHPTIQVGIAANWRKRRPNDHNLPDDAEYTVGLLGLLNGIFGKPEGGPIAAIYNFVCDTCKAENVPEFDEPRKLTSGDLCPLCYKGKLVLGQVAGFKNLWAKEEAKK